MNVSSVQSLFPQYGGLGRAGAGELDPLGGQRADAAGAPAADPTQRPEAANARPLEPLPGQRADEHRGDGDDQKGHERPAGELSAEDEQAIRKLQARDREVRAHEAAHLAAAGQYANGGASYTFQVGPDGRQYAVGGEVSIDAGAEGTPEATLRKAQIVRAAALAPASPSGQDQAVAAAASEMAAQARQAMAEAQRAENEARAEAASQRSEASEAAGESSRADVAASASSLAEQVTSTAAGNVRFKIANAYAKAASGGPRVASLACPACSVQHAT